MAYWNEAEYASEEEYLNELVGSVEELEAEAMEWGEEDD